MSIKNLFPNLFPSLLLDFANTKRLDPRITFSRASTARYYDGKTVAKAEENLVTYSQEFDNAAWSKTNSAVTANSTTAPDGTSTADTLDEQTATGVHQLGATVTLVASSSYVISCFFKDNTAQYVQLGLWGSASQYATVEFDLTAGTAPNTFTAGTGWAVSSSSITSVGGSWYRCVAVITAGTAGGSVAGIALSDGTSAVSNRGIRSYAGTSRTAFVWGAQLEQRSAVTAYSATTTQPITNYIPALQTAAAGQARFDHNGAESLGLLIEEQRTNSFERSEEFDNAYWTKTGLTIGANVIVAPNGTLTGDKLIEDTGNSFHRVQTIVVTSANPHAISVYAKAAERGFMFLRDATNAVGVWFNLTNGTVGTQNAGITGSIQFVGNGWYRCTALRTTLAASTTWAIGVANADAAGSYTGDGYSGIYIWGAQLEAGAFATSYVPTTSASVTRSADAASMTGANFSSWYRADEGTMYAEFVRATTSTVARVLQVDDGTSSNRIYIGGGTTGTLVAVVGGTSAAGITSNTIAANQNVKVAGAYKVDNFAVSTSGAAVGTDTSGAIPVVTTARIGVNESGNPYLNGTIKKLSFYPVRCTDAQLIALTQ